MGLKPRPRHLLYSFCFINMKYEKLNLSCWKVVWNNYALVRLSLFRYFYVLKWKERKREWEWEWNGKFNSDVWLNFFDSWKCLQVLNKICISLLLHSTPLHSTPSMNNTKKRKKQEPTKNENETKASDTDSFVILKQKKMNSEKWRYFV